MTHISEAELLMEIEGMHFMQKRATGIGK